MAIEYGHSLIVELLDGLDGDRGQASGTQKGKMAMDPVAALSPEFLSGGSIPKMECSTDNGSDLLAVWRKGDHRGRLLLFAQAVDQLGGGHVQEAYAGVSSARDQELAVGRKR